MVFQIKSAIKITDKISFNDPKKGLLTFFREADEEFGYSFLEEMVIELVAGLGDGEATAVLVKDIDFEVVEVV